jgi:hypothetical protein
MGILRFGKNLETTPEERASALIAEDTRTHFLKTQA